MTTITPHVPTRQRDPWEEYADGRLAPAEIRQLAASTPPVALARRARHRRAKPAWRPMLPLWLSALILAFQALHEMNAANGARPGAVRRLARWVRTAGRAARYLWAVRAAIPWPVKVILAAAMVLKMMPLDFLADETLTVIAAVILNRTRPGLLKACFRAAQIRA